MGRLPIEKNSQQKKQDAGKSERFPVLLAAASGRRSPGTDWGMEKRVAQI